MVDDLEGLTVFAQIETREIEVIQN